MTKFEVTLFEEEGIAWRRVLDLIHRSANERGQTDGSYRESPAYARWVAAGAAIYAHFPRNFAGV